MSKTSVLIAGVSVTAVVGGWAYLVWSEGDTQASIPLTAPAPDTHTNTVANNWQWKNFNNTQSSTTADKNAASDKPQQKDALPYDAVEVYKVLQGLPLDDDGRLVPDQTVLKALEKGYRDLGSDLSPDAMAGLQDVIRKGLPGPAGEEAARMLENYYRYRSAEAEFNGQLVNQLPAASHYEELMQLRRNYLGQDVADQLYAVEHAQARHMLAAIAIEKDTSLTDEQKQAQHKALREKLNTRLIAQGQLDPEEVAAEKVNQLREQGASNAEIYSTRQAILGAEGARELAATDREEAKWQSRFNGYWQARRYVMQAGYDDAERQRQIEQLLNQYFSPDERDRARATSSEWQARDAT
jgi:lipase chaperone LimK